eukprot:Sdes_comp17493_c0_seq1m6730
MTELAPLENLNAISSLEDNSFCCICLSKCESLCFLNLCFHEFCFSCILEWSEKSNQCPLCKTNFGFVLHSLNAELDYQMFYFDSIKQPKDSDSDKYPISSLPIDLNPSELKFDDRFSSLFLPNENFSCSQSAFLKRKLIYRKNIWAAGFDCEYRRIALNPTMFSSKLSTPFTSRVFPFLRRDLIAILGISDIEILFQHIVSLLCTFQINSTEFIQHTRPFLLDHSEHFSHEFFEFSSSPFSLETFDRLSIYNFSPKQSPSMA